ncbi:hypothetical protein BG004_008235 [Podila humilis]|nr:hypothetical protein BG004_008235 [Podila humilis]
MICFDTTTYEMLRKQQEEELLARQLHQHQMWKHVQDRLAEQNKILEEEEKNFKKNKTLTKKNGIAVLPNNNSTGSGSASSSSSKTGTSTGSSTPESLSSTKRSIRWGLQNNMTKKFDKNQPLALENVPAMDKRPTKSALKIRMKLPTKSTDTKAQAAAVAATTPEQTATTTTTTPPTTKFPERMRAVSFF